MELNTLIFSNQLKHRMLRHTFFWSVLFCLSLVAGHGFLNIQGFKKIMLWDIWYICQTIPPQIPFCYFVLYFLIPFFFLRKQYAVSIIIFMGILFINWIINYIILQLLAPYYSAFFGLNLYPTEELKVFAFARTFDNFGFLVSCSLMCALKFLKIWYVKQQENTELARENAKAELQLLKAQVHPHFLFNTLNNIYSFTLTKSPMAADLVDKLFGILQYMILEGRNTLVPLKKEIKLIQDYISLEKVRYGDRLNISVDIKGDTETKFIAPLLLIPFVENSFKHGSSKMLADPKVELSIIVDGPQLIFMLRNNKPNFNIQESQSNSKGGIGLKNVAKRLQLLYPDKHTLKIESTDTSFYVYMHIMLREMKEVNIENPDVPATPQPLSYASP